MGRRRIEETYFKLKRTSCIRYKTPLSYYPEVFSVSTGLVKQWARFLGLVAVPGLYQDLSLEKGKYEGGFKVWESTRDLIKFLTEDQIIINELLHRGAPFKSLELGAGSSLATLALLSRLIKDPLFDNHYEFHIQDYNWEVLASLTLMNFASNLPLDYLEALIETRCLQFFYGHWNNFKASSKYDLIIMSEVIYDAENYEALHNILAQYTKKNGFVVLATKDTYFGLSGGLYTWVDYMKSKKIFKVDTRISVTTTNIPRSILIMKRSND